MIGFAVWEMIQFQMTREGCVQHIFMGGASLVTGPDKEGVTKRGERGRRGQGAKVDGEKGQGEEEEGRRTKFAWTSERVRKSM